MNIEINVLKPKIFWKTPDTALYSTYVSTLWSRGFNITTAWNMNCMLSHIVASVLEQYWNACHSIS
jgi:hypothetical protein